MDREEAIAVIKEELSDIFEIRDRLGGNDPSEDESLTEAIQVALGEMEQNQEWSEWPMCPRCNQRLQIHIGGKVLCPSCMLIFDIEVRYRVKGERNETA